MSTNRRDRKLLGPQIASLAAGKHYDGGGLILNVKPSGARSWVVRLTIDGRQKDIGIGGFPAVSLGAARRRAAELRDQVRAGRDPVAERRAAAPTFAAAAADVHAQKRGAMTSTLAHDAWINRLRLHALPTLGSLPVDRITRDDVLRALLPIWSDIPHTAKKVREGMRQVFRYAMARGWIDLNPAGEMIDGALLRQPAGGNRPAAEWSEVPAVMARIADHDGSDPTRLLLAFMILTAARVGEASGARWSEIDTAAETWTLPAERMKSRRAHVVPLSAAALAVVEQAEALRWTRSPFVFPSPVNPQRPIHTSTVSRLIARLGIVAADGETKATAHGFRSAFKTWAISATAAPWAVSEAALAHRVGSSLEARYVRSDLLDQRRALMAQWGAFATMPAAVEVPDTLPAA